MRRLLLLSLLPLLACAALFKGNLKKKDVASIAFDTKVLEICPGEQRQFQLIANTTDGKSWSTKDKVVWMAYEMRGEGVEMTPKGVYTIPANPVETWGRTGKVHAIAVDHPEKTADAVVQPVYNCQFFANYSGYGGRSGMVGNNGSTGSSGSQGGNGAAGADGERGGAGDQVEVYITMGVNPFTKKPILQVKIHSITHNQDSLWAVDPEGGSLVVDVSGGPGGSGGDGGRGGDGGAGSNNGPGGNGGVGGNGGDGGDGGDGGTVSVLVSESAKPYLGLFTFRNGGGDGGRPGYGGSGGSGGSGSNGAASGAGGPQGQPSPNYGQGGRAGPAPTTKTTTVKTLW